MGVAAGPPRRLSRLGLDRWRHRCHRLHRLGGDLDGSRVLRTYARLGIASVPAALLSGAACYAIGHSLGQGVGGSFAALLGGGALLLGVFYVAARKMRIEELNSMVGMVRGRLGR